MAKHRTRVTKLHYFRLTYRSLMFLAVLVVYIYRKVNGLGSMLDAIEGEFPFILVIVWVIFMVEMIFRFFPSNWESPGCQKQFKCNYHPTGQTDVVLHDNHAGFIVALVWILFNMGIGGLYQLKVIGVDVLLLVCLAYSVCDMICILFFCPFQTWFLKNICCVSCRIYNWDYAMMFTPMFFIPRIYTWTLLAAAIALLIRWEIVLWKYPERFSANTNDYLSCENCTEKLCASKKHLIKLKDEIKEYKEERIKNILKK